jgi:peptide/nickel transport system permease protein
VSAETLVGVQSPPSPQRRRSRATSLRVGTVLGLLIVAVAALAPVLATHDPYQQDLSNSFEGWTDEHLLGTDLLGRDLFSRLLYGLRLDLRIAVTAVALTFLVGLVLGALAGYGPRWLDTLIMRIGDAIIAFPTLVLLLTLVFVLGPGELSIYIWAVTFSWVPYARILRSELLVARGQEYVLAATVGGLSKLRIVVRHLLPNTITQSVVFAMSDVVFMMLSIVVLSYLGLGVPPPTPGLGQLIAEGQNLVTVSPALVTIPGLVIVVVGIAASLLGDGLAAKLDRR